MTGTLSPPLDPSKDLMMVIAEGGVPVVVFVDFCDPQTRRVRSALPRGRVSDASKPYQLALRLVPAPLAGSPSDIAARAAVAASYQGCLVEMHDALIEGPLTITQDAVRGYAAELALDIARFEADMVSEQTDATLAEHAASYAASHSPQTPWVFIDGRPFLDAWDADILARAINRPLALWIKEASEEFFNWAASAGLVLVLATIAALLIVNLGGAGWYGHLIHAEVGLSAGNWSLTLSAEQWVNDGLMALFFLLVGLEIKREIVSGELSSWDKAILPIVGAVGGMLVPALIYFSLNVGTDTASGWGIPMATDIAFTLGILAILGDRVPPSLKIFVSALAIADDLGAILVIAVFYSHGFHLDAALWALAVIGVMLVLNLTSIYARTPYLILGVVLWYFVHESGLHATLAGVLTAALIPSRRPASAKGVAIYAEEVIQEEFSKQEAGSRAIARLQSAVDSLREPGWHLQHSLENWSNFLVLPLFAFFNTGLVLAGASISVFAPEISGTVLGLVLGKPLGICLLVWLSVRLGIATLSPEITWRHMIGAAALCGVGFTMSIVIASAAFGGQQLADVKLAILAASVLAAVLGALVLLNARPVAKGAKG